MHTQGTALPRTTGADPHTPASRERGRGSQRPAEPDGLAATAMELGTNALISSVVLIGGLLGLVGLVLGTAALTRAGRTGCGRRQALVAVATSLLAIAVATLVALLAVWCAQQTQGYCRFDHVHQYGRTLLKVLRGCSGQP
ncbi:DUF4190 domain-containing protein [Kitasatospora sp. NBC_01266]|uniref:DUF4190 domain-containing protein n=1 Tax=Kitasatospora sp. NBC_01266 TaxID=2903572 RepID=UPI002E3247EF|nr:DUF4190 domain-containing protein [Kitasatospora sp. NBC_01266]